MSPVALPTISAAVLYGPRDLRIEDRTLWPPQPNHAQVQIISTGLCGSDLHYYIQGRNGDFAVRQPLVLGHEAAGIVKAVGPGVTNVKVGQRVAIEAGIFCRDCNFCEKGRYNLCKSMRFCSSASVYPHLDGTLQTRMNHPSHLLHPLPDTCSFELASLAEPLSVLIHASRRANFQPNQSVLVFGVGAIGLLACALSKSNGASRVVAIDINQSRLDFALRNGFASQVYCLPPLEKEKAKTSEEVLRRAKENAHLALGAFDARDGFDVVFECTGAEAAIQMSIHASITGGKVMLIGMGSRNVLLPLSTAALREVDILGSFRYCNTYTEALKLLSSSSTSSSPSSTSTPSSSSSPKSDSKRGVLTNVDRLVTHRFGLGDTRKAFEMLAKGVDERGGLVLKVMVGAEV